MLRAFWEQKGKCFYCSVDLLQLPFSQTTRDHMHPKSLGGTEIVISCMVCNRLKAAHPYEKWLAWIAEHGSAVKAYNEAFRTS
jgi:5-methylcytosine-specific restriction endonuclease McrA